MSQLALRSYDVADDDPFYWGSRCVAASSADGRRFVEVPLRRADVIDPQEGDVMVHGPQHGRMIRQVSDMLERWSIAQGRAMAVFDDVKILWGIPGLPDPAPDISVIPGIRNPDNFRQASFSVLQEGRKPCLVIEVVSERYAEVDYVDKVRVYQQAGVAEYLILDVEQTPVALTGYRRNAAGRFRRHGTRRRWLSVTTGLRFRSSPYPLDLIIEDVATGRRLLTSLEEEAMRRAKTAMLRLETDIRLKAEARAELAEQRALLAERRLAELTAELDRLRPPPL